MFELVNEQKVDELKAKNFILEQEIERLNCIIELTINLKQQSESQINILEKDNKQLKEALKNAIAYYPNEYGPLDCEYVRLINESED